MPVTVKTSTIKYKDSSGNYVGVNAFSESTTAELVAAVNDKGVEKVNTLNERAQEIAASLPTAGEMEEMVASPFDSSKAYPIGEYCIHENNDSPAVNTLYRFKTPHAENDPWSFSEVVAIKLADETSDLKSAIDQGAKMINALDIDGASYKSNKYVSSPFTENSSTDYEYCIIPVTSVDKIILTATSMSAAPIGVYYSDTPAAGTYISKENIDYPASFGLITKTDYQLTIPSNAKYVLINNRKTATAMKVEILSLQYDKDNVEKLKTEVGKLSGLVECLQDETVTVTDKKYVSSPYTEYSSNDYEYCIVPVSKGEKVVITAASMSAAPIGMYYSDTPSQSNYISKENITYPASFGIVTKTDYELTIPVGAKYVIISNRKDTATLSVKKETTQYSADRIQTALNKVSEAQNDITELGEKVDALTMPITKITVENPVCIDNFSTGGSQYISKEDNVITINYTPSSGNHWFTYDLETEELKTNFLRMTFTLRNLSANGWFRAWMFAKTTSGSAKYVVLRELQANGNYSIDIDLNYYVVYENLDLSKPIQFGIGNNTAPGYVEIVDFNVENIVSEFNTDKSFAENMNDIILQVEENKNGIIGLTNNQYLVSSNGTKYMLSVTNDGSIHGIPTIPGKTLFVGNSLLLGNGLFGMAASDETKDYFYKVKQEILSKNGSATFDKLSGTAFEGAASTSVASNWMSQTLLPKLGDSVNLVIVQLGDNVNTSALVEVFGTTCGMLIEYIKEHAPNARVAWVGEWYSSEQRQTIISNACIAKGATFVDISALNVQGNRSYLGAVINYGASASRTYTIDSYTDDPTNHVLTVKFTVNGTEYTSEVPYTSYSTSGNNITITGNYGFVNNMGIASHPGDSGFSEIGDKIIQVLGL